MISRLQSWHRSLSISARTAWSLAIGFTLVILAITWFVFNAERSGAIAESQAKLARHNAKIVDELGERFDRIGRAQARAAQLFQIERAALTPAQARREFNLLFPLQPDGTHRSTDILFDGGRTAIGYVEGMAAFIPAGISRNDAAVIDLIAATRALNALREGIQFDLESLYFFTPADGMVIFAPKRMDRLQFYRKEAPADFSFQKLQIARLSGRAVNPGRQMKCAGLQSLISLQNHDVWTTGCSTPIDRDGKHIGSFGTSMPLDQIVPAGYFARASDDDVILVSREGRLIYHHDYTLQNNRGTEKYLDLTKTTQPKLFALWELVRKHGATGFDGKSDKLDAYVSLHAVPGSDWYALTVKPESLIVAAAWHPIPRIAAMAFIALVGYVTAITLALRGLVGRPLRQLTRDAQRITRELANDAIVALPESDTGGNEIAQLVNRFETMAGAIRHSHASLEERVAERTGALNAANEKLLILSEIDPLTGIANRRKIMAELDTRVARMQAGSAMALLVIDVDNFKSINDQYGHVAGDDALRALAERIQSLLRAGDALGRIGGEEFMVVLDRARPVIADAIAERIRAAIATQIVQVHGDVALTISVSMGVANWYPGETTTNLYARADAALYRAKAAGRNCAISSRQDNSLGRNAA